MKIPKRTVDYNVKFKTQGNITNNYRQDRPRATTSREDLNIIIRSKRNRRLTVPEITARVNKGRNKSVSVFTIKILLLERLD
ncbi:tc1-like transporase protein [Lasius niger]|uniref:Tc1-like transporase protein n=1 Tax=Lasius niger TaxID=67767 RepID=A0A0J7NDI4_LASNI|nr:tc1-like transporase protein [Lasius niger]